MGGKAMDDNQHSEYAWEYSYFACQPSLYINKYEIAKKRKGDVILNCIQGSFPLIFVVVAAVVVYTYINIYTAITRESESV